MKTIIKIFFLMQLLIIVSAQQSSHYYDKIQNHNNAADSYDLQITQFNNSLELQKNVFGYLPYWELNDANIRLDLLTHLAVFDFVLLSDGSVSYPPGWNNNLSKWIQIISSAQESNVKVIMTVSNLSLDAVDSNLVSNLINNNSNKEKFFENIKSIITDFHFDGINIDFENLKLSERGDPINFFMQELRDSLDTWFVSKELSFATPAVNWDDRWKLEELSEICDYLFIMGYDYHGSWSENAGPVAPLNGTNEFSPYNYKRTISNDYADVEPSKIILGVPYYGAEWLVDTNDPYTTVIPKGNPNTNWVKHVNYEDVYNLFADNNYSAFDEISQTPYVMIPQGDEFQLIWMDIVPSLELKYNFVIEKQLSGIGIWSLGKDGNRNELWNLIEKKFTDSTTSVVSETVVNDFVLFQNYPNPFNPTTTIKFTLPNVGDEYIRPPQTRLVVYDILGREVATLISKILQPGNHEVIFDAGNFSSGIYFYTLTHGSFCQSLKMILAK
ncbi:MAG TPA: T9SS type A sorting domain-containing protein [Ignavibacteria bacterium]|nr:T9SS type A sorting domain-containing protein [Ignavibacteria bacterium]